MSLTQGSLLGGRVRYSQPAHGYRTGIEPVLLAASVPARPGERVLEVGTGAGAGLLCLAARVPGVVGVGIEQDADQAALAAANFAENGFDGLSVVQADVLGWRADKPFDHAFANPPWHHPLGTPAGTPGTRAAKISAPGLLAAWARSMATSLRQGGSISLVLPAAHMAEAIVALTAADCAQIMLLPLWPKEGVAAKIIILRGVRHGKGACKLATGVILHEADGAFTQDAQAVLRQGNGLPIAP